VTQRLVIATRGSALALWQAEHVKARLAAVAPDVAVEFNVIKTSGDQILDVPLAKVGGKGLFVKEIEQALLDLQADLAVHSMKDVPAELAPGLVLVAVSSREVPWDALCARAPVTVDTLPRGARVGTSSMRRQCQLLARRPDLQIAMLRGNVPTRIRKLDDGEFDAIVLAAAGLTRLGLAGRITQQLPLDVSVPAVAQGVLGLEARAGDARVAELIRRAIHDPAGSPPSAASWRGWAAAARRRSRRTRSMPAPASCASSACAACPTAAGSCAPSTPAPRWTPSRSAGGTPTTCSPRAPIGSSRRPSRLVV
jgi:hydroxymethylbilane synthase